MNLPKLLMDYSFEELDRELIARGAQKIKNGTISLEIPNPTPDQQEMMERLKKMYDAASMPAPGFASFSDGELVKRLKELARGEKKNDTDDKHRRGIIEEDDRLDFYELEEAVNATINPIKVNSRLTRPHPSYSTKNLEILIKQADMEKLKKIKNNLDTVALLCLKDSLEETNQWANLNVRDYKKTYSLCECERFTNQPIINGKACTCFLVSEDVVATAGHFLRECKNPQHCRVVFGYQMKDYSTPITQIPREQVYQGVEFINICDGRDEKTPDWALLRLNRRVTGQKIVHLYPYALTPGQQVYTIGFPVGLPMKFATGARVQDTRNEYLFSADLDVFMGNSGSPVFDMNTHEVVGMAVKGYANDFRALENCWISLIYPAPGANTPLSKCTRISLLREPLEIDRSRKFKENH